MNATLIEGGRPVSDVIPPRIIERLSEFVSRIRARIREVHDAQHENYEIAGLPVCFRFLDPRIKEQVSPAFQHLRTAMHIQPELDVVLDGASSPLANLAHVLDWDGWGERDVWAIKLEEMMLIIQQNGTAVSALDYSNKTGYRLERRTTGMTYLDRAAPMRHLLSLWFGSQGRYLFHGAAVGESEGGVLILGAGGSGKSTTALACLEDGMAYAGDDRCLLSMDGLPHVYSLYGTAKLLDINQFPSFAPVVDMDGNTCNEKAMYRLHRLSDNTLHCGFALRAILLAHIEDIQETRISPASHARGFLELAASGALHLPKMRIQALCCFNSVARQLPVYDLTLGANIRSTPDAIRKLLRELL
jgi:hypothetical protein